MNDIIDPALIKDIYIDTSQEEYIRPVLTQDMYDEIVSENLAGVFTGLNETLLNTYLKPALAFYVASEVVTPMDLRMTTKGLQKNTSETSEIATRQERVDMIEFYRKHAQTLIDKAIRYIEDNESSFPLYQNGSSEPNGNKIIGGIIL